MQIFRTFDSMNVLLNLDTRRKKKDGTYPILLRLSGENEKTLPISTGYSVTKEYWLEAKREIRKGYNGYQSVSRINNILTGKRNEAGKVITLLEEQGILSTLSIHDVKNRIISVFYKPEAQEVIAKLRAQNVIASDKKQQGILKYLDALVDNGELAETSKADWSRLFTEQLKAGSVFEFIRKIESDLKEIDKVGNAHAYRSLRGALFNFWGSEDLNFNQINLEFLQNLEKSHLKKGLKINGLGTYMRTLRATYNKAVAAGIADKDSNPFSEYTIKKEPTAKRAISQKYLAEMFNLALEKDSALFHARNFFFASFTCQGMSFIDMAFLKKKYVFDGRVKYRRTKTSRIYNIKLTEMLGAIFEYYARDKGPEDFIFPIIKRESLAEQYKDIKWARKRYNARLKEIGQKCGIEENLTSYVSRHSFAMSARLANTPIEVISQMLGHKDTKTTQIYLDSIPDKTVDDYADKVLDFTNEAMLLSK